MQALPAGGSPSIPFSPPIEATFSITFQIAEDAALNRPDKADAEAVRAYDLAKLKPANDFRLDGKLALFHMVINRPADRQGDRDV